MRRTTTDLQPQHPRQPEFFEGPRILVREITGEGTHRVHAAFVRGDFVNYKTILNVLLKPGTRQRGFSDLFFLGIINSRVLSWYFPRASNKLVTETFPRISILDLKRFPCPALDLSNRKHKLVHDNIVKFVEQMINAAAALMGATTERQKQHYKNKQLAMDVQIDHWVYEAYGLSRKEVEIIEGQAAFSAGA